MSAAGFAYIDSPRPLKHAVRTQDGRPSSVTLCGVLIPMHRGWRMGEPTTLEAADTECLRCQARLTELRLARRIARRLGA